MHWIRARAQKDRWKEEFTLTGHEMQWTVRYFLYQAKLWEDRGIQSEHSGNQGPTAYAHRKVAMWNAMAKAAENCFKEVKRDFVSLVAIS